MSTMKAIIKGQASKVMSKSNGAEYVLINCLILDGPAKGSVVAGTRTVVNAEGIEKSIPSIDDEVTLHHSVVPSTSKPGSFVHFFEISTAMQTESNDALTALFGVTAEADNAI